MLPKILSILHKRYKKASIYCIGESTGSGVVMSALAKQSEGVRGVILCAAGSQPSFHNPATMGSKFIKGMATFVSQVDITSYLQHYLSDDSRVATEMINDPLAKKTQSAVQLLGTMNFIKEMPVRAAQLPSSIPVLVMQGTCGSNCSAGVSRTRFSSCQSARQRVRADSGFGTHSYWNIIRQIASSQQNRKLACEARRRQYQWHNGAQKMRATTKLFNFFDCRWIPVSGQN